MDILSGLAVVFSDPLVLLAVVLAAFVGVIVGAIPGLTAAAAIAMLVPLTFHLPPLIALAFLYVIGKAGRFGGSISAILFNTPGTAASAATMIDGHPMVRRGKSGKALKVAAAASMFGDFFGDLILILGVALIANYTEKLGPVEYFAAYMMAFLVIGTVISTSVVKGMLSTLFGILLGTVGLDPLAATPRYTFDNLELESGIGLVPLLIGIFVLSEVIEQSERRNAKQTRWVDQDVTADKEGQRLTWAEAKACLPVASRSALVGSAIGLLPGLGSAVACFVAYGMEKRRAPNAAEWGSGTVEGVAAPESANNAVSGPSMIPLLTLGIPGSTIAAILVSVFMIHGITVGPAIFRQDHDLIYALFASGLLGIACYGAIGFFAGPAIGRFVARIPPNWVYPFIFLTAIAAAYAPRNNLADVLLMVVAGIAGYGMRKAGFSTAALVIAFVLSRGAEESFRQSLLISNNGMWIFLERPFVIGCMVVTAVIAMSTMMRRRRQSNLPRE